MNPRETMRQLNDLLAQTEASYLRIAQENGLSYAQLMLLLMLADEEHLTQKMVCDALYLSKSSVHTMLADLMRRDILFLTEGGNKKEKYIVPAPAGEALIQKAVRETEIIENAALSTISEEETMRFIRTAETLADRMARETKRLYGGK